MRRIIICTVIASVALFLAGCAKDPGTDTNDMAQKYYNAWIQVKKEADPDYLWWPISYGTPATATDHERDYGYILADYPGDGEEIEDSCYMFVTYTQYDLTGSVIITTDKEVSHKTGLLYDPSYYYGSEVMENTEYDATLGLKDGIDGVCNGEQVYDKMRVGGRRIMIVPGWFSGSERVSDDINYYLNNVSGTDRVYDFTIEETTDDINQYQIDSIESYCSRMYKFSDSTYLGFYYKCINTPRTSVAFYEDTTICVNYVGRLLNGQVFDTNIADTAKMWNLYNASSSYGPIEVTWSSDSSSVKLGAVDDTSDDDNSVITGFASMISRMNDKETAVGIFYSELGYGVSGSGLKVPGYAPLEFKVWIVDEE